MAPTATFLSENQPTAVLQKNHVVDVTRRCCCGSKRGLSVPPVEQDMIHCYVLVYRVVGVLQAVRLCFHMPALTRARIIPSVGWNIGVAPILFERKRVHKNAMRNEGDTTTLLQVKRTTCCAYNVVLRLQCAELLLLVRSNRVRFAMA